jgi:hypothetical protein
MYFIYFYYKLYSFNTLKKSFLKKSLNLKLFFLIDSILFNLIIKKDKNLTNL